MGLNWRHYNETGDNAVRGASFVVQAGADDHVTDPAGNSGERIACACRQ